MTTQGDNTDWKETLAQLNDLLNDTSEEHHDKSCELCLRVLKHEDIPADVKNGVSTCYLRLCIRQAEDSSDDILYQKALEIIQHQDNSSYFAAEHAYCLYRQSKYSKARSICESVLGKDLSPTSQLSTSVEGLLHIYSQTLYRLNDLFHVQRVYKHLADNFETSQVSTFEILTNWVASAKPSKVNDSNVSAMLKGKQKLSEFYQDPQLVPYDLAYNVATAIAIDSNDPQELEIAASLFMQSQQACKVQNSDADDLIPMQCNQAVALYKQYAIDQDDSKKRLADAFSAKVVKNASPNSAPAAIANHNMALGNKKQQLPDPLKSGDIKLTDQQQSIILSNMALQFLESGKVEECRQILKRMRQINSVQADILEACLLDQQNKVKERDDFLKQAFKRNQAKELALLQAQFSLRNANDKAAALTAIKNIHDRTTPAIQATLVSLYKDLDQDDFVKELLQRLSVPLEDHEEMLQDAILRANYLYEMGQLDASVALYESLLTNLDDDDELKNTVVACLIRALASTDAARAKELAKTLPDPTTTAVVDPEELEWKPLPRLHRTRKVADAEGALQTKKKKQQQQQHRLRQRAKKREAYLAKLKAQGKSLTAKPDPERWIPKNQRSYSRRRGKLGGAQGAGAGTEKDAARLDVAARKAQGALPPPSNSTAHMTVVTSGTMMKRKGGRKKKT